MSEKKSGKGFIVLLLVIAALCITFILFGGKIFTFIKDTIRSSSYEATSEELEVIENLELTDEGERLFKVAHLQVVESQQLKDMCDPEESEESLTGGCYVNEDIYVYNFTTDFTKQYKYYTAAHELLHVVYSRMSKGEVEEINKLLDEVYNDERYHEQLEIELSSEKYDDYRYNELHSRVGTEIADIPHALEEHYAKYFKNRNKIVGYYDSVYVPLHEAGERIEELEAQLNEMEDKLEEYSKKGNEWAEDYNDRVNKHNECIYEPGCYVGNEAFDMRQSLANEQEELDAYLREWKQYFDEYSTTYDEYAELYNEYQGFFGELKTWKKENAPEE